jgi:hypothetical protein
VGVLMDRKIILLSLFVLMLIPIAFGEIVVINQDENNVDHTFYVNKYYFKQQHKEIIYTKQSTLVIEPIISENTVSACERTNFTFKLYNPSSISQIYHLSVDEFDGYAYLVQSLKLGAKTAALVEFQLQPDCESSGELNPKIMVETATESAKVPLSLYVNPIEIIRNDNCLYYFNSSVCQSKDYIRFYQGTKYNLDLSNFQDPDGDFLKITSQPLHFNVKVKNNEAKIWPRFNFEGAEEIVFTAEDGKGGRAFSKSYFVHVLDNGQSAFRNFLSYYWFNILLGFLIFLILLLLIIKLIKCSFSDCDEDNDIE